jgi:GTP cyclohydrolase II
MGLIELAAEEDFAGARRLRWTDRRHAEMLAVDVAIAVLRRGLPIVVAGGADDGILGLAAESSTPEAANLLTRLTATSVRAIWALACDQDRTSATRFQVGCAEVGRDAAGMVALGPLGLRSSLGSREGSGQADVGQSGEALLQLVKIAGLLPTALVAPISGATTDTAGWAARHCLPHVTAGAILSYQDRSAETLCEVSRAEVPLVDAASTKFIVFRPRFGSPEHIAVMIGNPDSARPVLARLHSACLTGDLFGSLRCDCGEQLRGAIAAIAHKGGGVLLYLAQEGRGIGLVNKLRSYELQDEGLDTVDANHRLGFAADERLYRAAAEIFRQLGFNKVRLMTNNPDKVSALERYGISVVERIRHVFAPNPHNVKYLDAKRTRSGHLL